MKEWVTPKLLELKAEWTQNKIDADGSDGPIPGVSIGGVLHDVGSC